jgi:hypothetical protein
LAAAAAAIEGFYAHLVENGRKTDNENDMALYHPGIATFFYHLLTGERGEIIS